MGYIFNRLGRPEETIKLLGNMEYLRTSPITAGWLLSELGWAYHLTGRYEEAVTTLKQGLAHKPVAMTTFDTHLYLAATYTALGREEDARAEAADVLKISPGFSVEVWGKRSPYKDQALLQRFMAALREAGLR